MSLTVYTNKQDIPSNIKYVNYNDKFFSSVSLKDDILTKSVLSIIDKATYSSKDTFIGRDKSLGALNKSLLSTGCKTILNIVAHPEICFDVIECGQNALRCLTLLTQGNILWTLPVLIVDKDEKCDIEIKRLKFTSTLLLAEYFVRLAIGEDDE